MVIFSTSPSYKWSPSRRKYVLDCGLETTAIMPLGARTIPSRRSVLTCSPALPGGRLAAPLPCEEWLSKDSNGSRRAAFTSLSAAAGLGALAVFSAGAFAAPFFLPLADLPADFAAGFAWAPVGFATVGPAGFPACGAGLPAGTVAGLYGACAAGLAGACAAGFAGVCEAGFAGVCAAGFAGAGVPGLAAVGVPGLAGCCAAWPACACKPGAVTAIKSPIPRVIAERIVRSFPLRVSQARWQASLQLL